MMVYYQRAILYLRRKFGKTILLFMVMLLIDGLILGTTMILHAAENNETVMRGKSDTKVIAEVNDVAQPINENEVKMIKKLATVTSINRMRQQAVCLTSLVPVTASTKSEENNHKVVLLAYDDLENDGPFVNQDYRLIEGKLLCANASHCAIVNADFAEANNLSLGSTLSFYNNGETVEVTIIGEYLAGYENQQNNETLAVDRIENQIYIDQTTFSELFGNGGFYKIAVYTDQPEQLNILADEVESILQNKATVTTSDAFYRQLNTPLTKIMEIVRLMRCFSFIAGVGIVSLLLCLWMRSRQKEMAVLISLGEKKWQIVLQAFVESGVIFLSAAFTACVLSIPVVKWLPYALPAALSLAYQWSIFAQYGDIVHLVIISGIVMSISVSLSLIPVFKTKPKEILSRMEE